jgi:uncharacterized protein (DUF2249 family)
MAHSVTFKKFDARKLLTQGEEPFAEIRRRVDALKTGQGLEVVAAFLPSPLIEKLRSEGFSSRAEPQPAGVWIVYFWRDGTALP